MIRRTYNMKGRTIKIFHYNTCKEANWLGTNDEKSRVSLSHSCEISPSVMQSKKSMACFFNLQGRVAEQNTCLNMPIACHLLVWLCRISFFTAVKSSSALWATSLDISPHITVPGSKQIWSCKRTEGKLHESERSYGKLQQNTLSMHCQILPERAAPRLILGKGAQKLSSSTHMKKNLSL